tara:strand:- start:3928 stop:4116 length:189 start_codon:yes stop_codon:yes gene_type:complete
MKNSSKEIQKFLSNAETSKNNTAQLQQALAQNDANLSRKENQKVSEKSQKTYIYLCQEVSNL